MPAGIYAEHNNRALVGKGAELNTADSLMKHRSEFNQSTWQRGMETPSYQKVTECDFTKNAKLGYLHLSHARCSHAAWGKGIF